MSKWEGQTTHEIASEVTMAVTRAQRKNQIEQEQPQSKDEAISHSLEQEPVVEGSSTKDECTNSVPELSMEKFFFIIFIHTNK